MLFDAFSTFFMKSMKKVEKAPKSKQGVFLMQSRTCPKYQSIESHQFIAVAQRGKVFGSIY